MKIKGYKEGITMLMLIVIIMVTLIITSTVIVSYSSFKNNSKKKAFVNEILTISKQIEQYKLINSKYPIQNTEIDKSDLNQELREELKEHKIYKIDLEKLDISALSRGKGAEGTLDYYAYCIDTNTVYYVQGAKIGDNIYYYYNQELYKFIKGKKV